MWQKCEIAFLHEELSKSLKQAVVILVKIPTFSLYFVTATEFDFCRYFRMRIENSC